jgi:hypothetical protein
MTSIIYVFLVSTVSLVTAANFSVDVKFNRDVCYARTLEFIKNGTLLLNDEVFFRDSSGQTMVNPNNLTLTLPGCRKLCGAKQGWYWDIGPRLSTWLIPILLLISNIELSPLDKRRFLAILHLLGDPIDSIWSLVHKIDAWDRSYSLAEQHDAFCERCKRVIATVFAGFEEIEGPGITSQEYFDTLVKRSGLNQEDKFREWRRTAVELADSRTDEFLRTCLAILLYIYQVIAGFLKEVGGGNTSPPGGRIGTAMFISWLVPVVLLSNAIGGFTSRHTCFNILWRFAERTNNPFVTLPRESILFRMHTYLMRTSSTEYFKSLSWSGAIYTFRPWKTQYITCKRDWRRTALILFLSISPICIGMTGAFIIIWYTLPNGLNCRHFWLIGIFLAWFVSVFITWLSYSPRFATGKYHWCFILVKDTLIAIPSIILIFLSSCGLFNSCFCWSGFFYYRNSAHVPLNSDPFYEHNDRTIYPAVVGVCLFLQLTAFVIIATTWRHGLKLMRWSEKARREEWESANGYCTYVRANGPFSWILLQWWCSPSLKRWSEKRGRKRLERTHTCCHANSTEGMRSIISTAN